MSQCPPPLNTHLVVCCASEISFTFLKLKQNSCYYFEWHDFCFRLRAIDIARPQIGRMCWNVWILRTILTCVFNWNWTKRSPSDQLLVWLSRIHADSFSWIVRLALSTDPWRRNFDRWGKKVACTGIVTTVVGQKHPTELTCHFDIADAPHKSLADSENKVDPVRGN